MKPPLLLAVGITSVAAVLLGAVLWATRDTAPAATAEAVAANSQACGRRVVADWYDDGRVGKLYPLACYQVALDLTPVDMDFSSPRGEIQRALELARTGTIAPASLGQAGVFGVKVGMTRMQVRRLAGAPYREGAKCWIYHASKQGESEAVGLT